MEKTGVTVLKASQVKLAGQVQLGPQTALSPGPQDQAAGETTPQLSIVEDRADHLLLELRCSCGRTHILKCEYASEHPAVSTPDQKPSSGENENAN